MRWKHVLNNSNQHDNAVPKYRWYSKLSRPGEELRDHALEEKLRRIYYKTKAVIKHENFKPMLHNLTENERQALRNLKEKDFIFLPSDKGGEFCVISQSEYRNLALSHLSDDSTYLHISHMTACTIEKKINAVWKTVANESHLPYHVLRSYVSTNTSLPRFYHLIKTHKNDITTKIRPIVSNTNGPTKKIAWLLTSLLTPLLKTVPAHLENSFQLITNIKYIKTNNISSNNYPCSFDIKSMYTSIPIQNAIENVKTKLENHNVCRKITIQNIESLLTVILQNTYFEFDKKIYKQIDGLPMGSSLSGLLAILYVDSIERSALQSMPTSILFHRYVDDCFSIVKDRDEALELLHKLNSVDTKVQFEIEFPSTDNSLELLDFKITLSASDAKFTFYRKPARKNLFVNFRSHMPHASKISVIHNERLRITERCSSNSEAQAFNKQFDKILAINGYPVESIAHSKTIIATRKKKNEDYMYLKLPYINDKVEHTITRIFKKEGINIRIAHRNRTLRTFLSKHQTQECTLQDCPINNKKKCHLRNVVYRLTCNLCQKTYIGSTIRLLHTRIKEHHNSNQSSVFKHLHDCRNTTFDIDIIGRESDEANLRLREAILIRQHKPQINSKHELEQFQDFLFL